MKTKPPQELKVLVLEDDEFQRRYLVQCLRKLGVHGVLEAADGHAALAVLSEHADEVDIAFCDLRMEGMDGVEFIRQASRLRVRAFVPVSALAEDIVSAVEHMAKACGARVIGRLPKPVRTEALRDLIARESPRSTAPQATGDVLHLPPRELQRGLEAGEIVGWFQPKMDLGTGRLVGAEALARWNHPVHGMLAPAHFVDDIEAAGLMSHLTDGMIDRSLRFLDACGEAGLDGISVSFNASPSDLQEIEFAGTLIAKCREHGVPPERVVVEVTEAALASDAAGLLATLSRLRIHGFRLSIDDFGTGYSTMELLHNLPFTELKLDRSFVHGAAEAPRTRALLTSIVELARSVSLETVAEGMENEADVRILRELGCDVGQGYYYAKPMPSADFLAWAGRNVHAAAPRRALQV